MKLVSVNPEEIIGLNDYPPLHSPESLKKYFRFFINNDDKHIFSVPLITISSALPILQEDPKFSPYIKVLQKFLSEHKGVNYFQSGGKHRSSAAYLARKKVPGIVIENDEDIKKIKPLLGDDKFLTEDSFEGVILGIKGSFLKHDRKFWTVKEKTEAMIANGNIPKDIVDYFRSS
ncbi:hypothetical protein J4230_02700 [Candidatus Woesearchaeota archaeon]|nr:hypothetical protein [Candidatus Woesearchaeota archaeon]